jgi:hypothetical protein
MLDSTSLCHPRCIHAYAKMSVLFLGYTFPSTGMEALFTVHPSFLYSQHREIIEYTY